VSIVDRVVASYFRVISGELVIGGVPVSEIANDFGTPTFVYDGSVLDASWDRLRRALPDRVEVFYSVKANPNRVILKHFLERGAGLEIASGGELSQALAAGASPERIVFAGPGKSETETREFLSIGGGEIHVESMNEAERLGRLAAELGVVVRAAVRVNPTAEALGGAMRMGGKAAPFGVDEESMEDVVDVLMSARHVSLAGVHIFAGTQILDADVLAVQYRKCLEIARKVARRIDAPLATVDFGGGLGIPYFDGEEALDIERFGRLVAELLDAIDDEHLRETRFLVEPGRYLAGEAGIYLCRIADVKESRGKRFIVLDGGMHHHLAASGNLGQVVKRNFPIAVVNRMEHADVSPAEVVGPLCTPLDTLARKLPLPAAEVGDLVGVFQSGAYARAASPLGFLSHPSPAEIFVADGEARLVRRRGTYADLTHDLID